MFEFLFVVDVVLLLCQKHIICHKRLQFLYNLQFYNYNFNLFSILKILQDLRPIIRVK